MTKKPLGEKPPKPYPEFPLRPHARGKWTKKIGGKSHYFGTWDDPYGALAEYEAFIGEASPKAKRRQTDALTLDEAAQLFLAAQDAKLKEGSLQPRTFEDYVRTAKRFTERLGRGRAVAGLKPADFGQYRQWLTTGMKWGVITTGNEIVRVRTMMTWIFDTHFPGQKPMFGPDFKRPGRKSLRRHRADADSKLLEPETIHRILTESGTHFRAMVLLGINCGYGVIDCARVPRKVMDAAISTGWLSWPRPKTGIERDCALWPETIAALQASAAERIDFDGKAKGEPFFVAPGGKRFDSNGRSYLIQGRWKAAKRAALLSHGSFYCLRHTCSTIADQTGDLVAVRVVMGHVDESISANYRHRIGERMIDDERLIRVAKKVRGYMGYAKKQSQPCPYSLSPVTSLTDKAA